MVHRYTLNKFIHSFYLLKYLLIFFLKDFICQIVKQGEFQVEEDAGFLLRKEPDAGTLQNPEIMT